MGFNNVININIGVERIMTSGFYLGTDIGVGVEKFFLQLESQTENTEDIKLEILNNNRELSNLTSFSFRTKVGYEFNYKNLSAILIGNIVGWSFITQIEEGEYSRLVENIDTEEINSFSSIKYNTENIKWAIEPQLNIRWSIPNTNISLQGGGSFRHELSDVFSGFSSSSVSNNASTSSVSTTGPVYVGNYRLNVGFVYSL
jgi:hypothetical protein